VAALSMGALVPPLCAAPGLPRTRRMPPFEARMLPGSCFGNKRGEVDRWPRTGPLRDRWARAGARDRGRGGVPVDRLAERRRQGGVLLGMSRRSGTIS
jgi:hypothetical protein